MPEASMDKHNFLKSGKYEIGSARKVLAVKTESVP